MQEAGWSIGTSELRTGALGPRPGSVTSSLEISLCSLSGEYLTPLASSLRVCAPHHHSPLRWPLSLSFAGSEYDICPQSKNINRWLPRSCTRGKGRQISLTPVMPRQRRPHESQILAQGVLVASMARSRPLDKGLDVPCNTAEICLDARGSPELCVLKQGHSSAGNCHSPALGALGSYLLR